MRSREMKTKMEKISGSYNFDEVKSKLERIDSQQEFKIGFIGEYDTGKTTLINCLLREDLLPTDDTPITSAVTKIKGLGTEADEREEFIVFDQEDQENQRKKVDKKEFFNSIAKSSSVHRGEAKIPARGILREKVVLVDTPGLHSLSEIDDQITYGYLPFCDAIFIVQELSDGSLKTSSRKFIAERVKETESSIRLILNKEDQIPPANRSDLYEKFHDDFKSIVENPVVFRVSAKKSLESLLNGENIEETSMFNVEDHIEKQIFPEVERIIEENLREKFGNIADQLADRLKNKLDALNWDDEKVEQTIKQLENEILRFEREEKNFENKFKKSKLETFKNIKPAIDKYSEKFMEAAQTSDSDPTNFKRMSSEMADEIRQVIMQAIEDNIKEIEDDIGEELLDGKNIQIDKGIVKTHLLVNKLSVAATTGLFIGWAVPGVFGPAFSFEIAGVMDGIEAAEVLPLLEEASQLAVGGGLAAAGDLAAILGKSRPVDELTDYGVEKDYISYLKRAGFITMNQIASLSQNEFISRMRKSLKGESIGDFGKDLLKKLSGKPTGKSAKQLKKIHIICVEHGTLSETEENLFRKAGELFNKVNPFDYIGNQITKLVGTEKFREEIYKRVLNSIELAFNGVEEQLRIYIRDNITEPKKNLKKDLESEKEAREAKMRDKKQYQEKLLSDIDKLKITAKGN